MEYLHHTSFKEYNRRPEPTQVGGGVIVGHDCANYAFSDPNGNIELDFTMVCEFIDGEPPDCPNNYQIVGTLDGKNLLRFPDPGNNNVFDYTQADLGQIEDSSGAHQSSDCKEPLVLINNVFIVPSLKFNGTISNQELDFSIPDRIVLSIRGN